MAIAKAKQRAAISNGSRLLDGVDGRSLTARRFKDLIAAYCTDLGRPYAAMTEPERNTVRQAAAAQLQSETLQAALVRGEAVDTDQLVRLSNLTVRLLRSLGLCGPGPTNDNEQPDLDTFLATRGAA
jgi:hypothetical protein